jgi:hypothetical protein
MFDVDSETRVGEVAVPAHLGDGHIRIPVRDRSFRRVRFVPDLGQAIRRRERQGRVLAVDVVARVVFAGTPGIVDSLLVGGQRWGECNDRPDVELAIRPAILSTTDPRHDRVVDRGVTQRAGNAELRDVIVRIHGGLEADDGVHLEQSDRRGRALEIDRLQNPRRQHVGVHLQPDLQGRCRVDALFDDLVQPELVCPELFVAKGIEPEDPLAIRDHRG